jgi:single-strand DNA-binding protein
MANLNKVILIGNLTRDPEARRTSTGTSVCRLGLAVNRRFKGATGEQREETTFVDIDVWGRQADFCRDYLRKGNSVYIDGRLKLDQWDDRATGQKRSRLCVVAESVQSLSGREGNSSGGYDQQSDQDGYRQQAPQSNQQQNWNAAPQGRPSAPPPPPFPARTQPEQAPYSPQDAPDPDAFDVSDESIDDIPF